MLFIGHFEANLLDKRSQNNHENRNYRVRCFHDFKSGFISSEAGGKTRKRGLKTIAKLPIDEKDKEIFFLQDRIYQLEIRIKIFQKQYHSTSRKSRYSLKERLLILWHMEYFQISRRQVTKTFGIARLTLYRWLKHIGQQPWNKTPEPLAALVWRIANDNIDWGRVRISNQLKLLNIILAASTVRNILQRPKLRNPPTVPCSKKPFAKNNKGCRIPAWYPNHFIA